MNDKAKAALDKLQGCAERDGCEQENCMYYCDPDDLMELLEWVCGVLDDERPLDD